MDSILTNSDIIAIDSAGGLMARKQNSGGESLSAHIAATARKDPAFAKALVRRAARSKLIGRKPTGVTKNGNVEMRFLAPATVNDQLRALALAEHSDLGPFLLRKLCEATGIKPPEMKPKGRAARKQP